MVPQLREEANRSRRKGVKPTGPSGFRGLEGARARPPSEIPATGQVLEALLTVLLVFLRFPAGASSSWRSCVWGRCCKNPLQGRCYPINNHVNFIFTRGRCACQAWSGR